MDDPDVPKALKADGMFDHWVLFNIPSDAKGIEEGKSIGIAGLNGAGQNAYTGPCPPPQYEPSTHRYFFQAFTLLMQCLIFRKILIKNSWKLQWNTI